MIRKIIIFILFIQLCSCFSKIYETKQITITAVNELQLCEEENIFYKIIDFNVFKKQNMNSRDSLVLFVLADALDEKENYDLFFSNMENKKRLKVTVRGYFSKKGTEIFSYGCYGSRKFKVTEIISIEDVTYDMDYSID